MKITVESVKEHLDKLSEDLILTEAKFIRVIRGGKLTRKVRARVGFKVIRRGNKVRMKRMTFQEKRNRHLIMMKVWRKSHASRAIKSKRKMLISLRKRKSVFGR